MTQNTTFTLAQVIEIARVMNPFASETQIMDVIETHLAPAAPEPAHEEGTHEEPQTVPQTEPQTEPRAVEDPAPATQTPPTSTGMAPEAAYKALWAVVNRKGVKQLNVNESERITYISTPKGLSASKRKRLIESVREAVEALGGNITDYEYALKTRDCHVFACLCTQALKDARKAAKVADRAAKRNKRNK